LDFGQMIWGEASFDSVKKGDNVQPEKGCLLSPITKMTYSELTRQFQNFRQNLYDSFERYCDSIMDLLDALSGNDRANSVAELSLDPLFRRGYSSLYKGIKFFFSQPLVSLLRSNVQNSLLGSNVQNSLRLLGSNVQNSLLRSNLKANLLRSDTKSI